MNLQQNTTPIKVEEFFDRVEKRLHQFKNYYSLYITSNGLLIDCGYPACAGHNEISEYIYENLNSLPKSPFNSCLRGEHVSFKEVPYILENKFNLYDIYSSNIKLFWTIDKVLLGTEDRICQDMGFVKVSINNKLKTFTVEIPNSIFEKSVTAKQKEILEKLSTYFNIDFISNLRNAQKENAKIASEIQYYLNKAQSNSI